MAPPRSRRPRVFVAGHFPPPRHGMSVATEQFATVLAERAPVIRLDTSGTRHGRSSRHHLTRLARSTVAGATILAAGPGDRLYAGSDAGPGMIYVALVVAAARIRGLPRYLHHHSFDYVRRHSRLMAALVRLGGDDLVHVFTCDGQSERFARLYPTARRRRTLPITFTLPEPVKAAGPSAGPSARRRGLHRSPPDHTIVLGHFGNLSMAKGLGRAILTLDRCVGSGIDAVLHLAGPVVDPEAVTVLAGARARLGPRLVERGPVDGAAKATYLGSLDVFLFPTRYRNESFGIVAAEAMAASVPVITYEAGCLDAAWVGDGGLVLDAAPVDDDAAADRDFADRARDQIATWISDPTAYERAASAAFDQARAGWEAGRRGAQDLADVITAAPVSGS